MTRLPGEDLYSGMTPAQRAARKLMDEYNRLNDATTRREEWMCVQAIVTGQIPIVGPGVNEVIDFGFTNKIKLDGTKQWGKTAAKPIEDLEDWTEKVLTGGFTNVDRVIMGKAALRAFINDEKVQKLLDNRRINIGGYDPRDLPNGVKYYGHLTSPNIDLYKMCIRDRWRTRPLPVRRTSSWTPSRAWARTRRRSKGGQQHEHGFGKKDFFLRA